MDLGTNETEYIGIKHTSFGVGGIRHNLYSYYFTGTFWSLKHISSHSFGPRDLKFTTQLANCLRLLKKEKFFRSNPQSRLQAQKGVISEGLEALLLPLEHCLLNRSC